MLDQELTAGEKYVGVSFNPSKNPDVDHIKAEAAALIDFIIDHGKDDRCTAIAVEAIEAGAMWAVKSVTKAAR